MRLDFYAPKLLGAEVKKKKLIRNFLALLVSKASKTCVAVD